jgi:hypothetical protein
MDRHYHLNIMNEVNRDAIIMEQLSSSPRIVDMYSHCGTSIMVKSMPYRVDNAVVPESESTNEPLPLEQSEANDEPRNNLTASTKLTMALEMAESLADLHGFSGGVIVHGDLQLSQWLRESPNSTLVLGNLNLARILPWDSKRQEYCKTPNGRRHGSVSRCAE